MTCVILDFPPTNGLGNVSKDIWRYDNEQVGSLHSPTVPSSWPVQTFYNYQPFAPTGYILQHPAYFQNLISSPQSPYIENVVSSPQSPYRENLVSSPRTPYRDCTQAPLILVKYPTAAAN